MSRSTFFNASQAATQPTPVFDRNHRDELGFDPFQMRKPALQRKVDDNDSFEEVIKKCNLWGDAKLPEKKALEKFQVPDYEHLIWLGERELGAGKIGRENILSWKKQNPEKICVVWTGIADPVTKNLMPDEIIEARKKWCQENDIILLDFEEVFAGVMPNEKIFYRELLRKNYGAASDLLRFAFLKKYHGIYSDIDIACKKPLGKQFAPMGIKINAKARTVTDAFKGVFENFTNSVINDLIMVSHDSTHVDAVIKMIAKNYQVSADVLFKSGISLGYFAEFKKYEEVFSTKLSSDRLFRELTIVRSGPGVFSRLFGEYEIIVKRRRGSEMLIDPAYFEFQSGRTWLDPESRQAIKTELKNVDIIKQILTNILADLQLEDSRIMRLDYYTKDLAKPMVAVTVLKMLCENYPELTSKIQYVKFFDCIKKDWAAYTLFFDTLFNQKYFPNLTRDGKFYKENFAFATELQQQGVVFAEADKLFAWALPRSDSISEFTDLIQFYENNNWSCHNLLLTAFNFSGYSGSNTVAVAALLQKGYTRDLDKILAEKKYSLAHYAVSCPDMATFKSIINYCVQHNCLDMSKKDSDNNTVLELAEKKLAWWNFSPNSPGALVCKEIRDYLQNLQVDSSFKLK